MIEKQILLKKGKIIEFWLKITNIGNKTLEKEYIKVPNVVVIIPVKDNGKLIIEKHYRPVLDQWIYEFPAGKIESNENPEEAARRELLEETGYYAEKLQPLFTTYVSPGYTTELAYFYIARDLIFKGRSETKEKIEILEVSVDEALKLIKNERYVDLKLIAGLLGYLSFTSLSSPF